MARLVSAASVDLLGVAAALAQHLLPLAQSRFKPVFAWKNRRSSKKKPKILKVCLGRPATSGYLLLATGSKPGLARWEVARGCRHWLYD